MINKIKRFIRNLMGRCEKCDGIMQLDSWKKGWCTKCGREQ